MLSKNTLRHFFLSMKVLLATFFILLLSATALRAQLYTGAQADSLKRVLPVAKPDTNRVNALLMLSRFYLNKTIDPKRDLDSALMLVKQAETLGKSLGFTKGVADAGFLEGQIYVYQDNIVGAHTIFKKLNNTNQIKLLLELGKYYLRPSYTRDAQLDSALIFFRRAESLSEGTGNIKWLDESRLHIGTFYLGQGDIAQGKRYCMSVIDSRGQAGDKAGQGLAWFRMSLSIFCKDKLCQGEVQKFNTEALKLFRELNDKPMEVIILSRIGNDYMYDADTDQAEHTMQQALTNQQLTNQRALSRTYDALLQTLNFRFNALGYISNANYALSELSFYKGDFNKSLFYNLQAIKEIESAGITHTLDYGYMRMGNLYYELGQLDKSIDYYQRSLNISRANGKAIVQLALAKAMTRTLIKLGRAGEALQHLLGLVGTTVQLNTEEKMDIGSGLAQCYVALHQYGQAEKQYLQNLAWSKLVDERHQLIVRFALSRFYVTSAQYAKADPYLRALLTVQKGKIPANILMEIHKMLFKIDSAQAIYPSAIRHYQLYKAFSDSIFNEKQSQQIAQLNIGYETEKKEQEIKLKEKNIALLEEQSKVQHTQRNALVGGTGLLVLMLGVVYNRYRSKQQSNKLLHAQQSKLQVQHEELQSQQASLRVQQQQIQEKNQILQQLLFEKERLLREIHHRVKNNLQIVMSLLNSQIASLQDKNALSAIQDSQNRVQTMALIHQKLYQSEGIARISMKAYIEEVVAYLQETYLTSRQVRFNLLIEPIELDVSLAVPLGLIINEALTNAFKYAFPSERFGAIQVTLRRQSDDTYELIIEDDGVGMPEGIDPSQSRSLGMTLIHGFSAQLGGELRIENNKGVKISLLFADEKLSTLQNTAEHAY